MEKTEDRLADFTTDRRVLILSGMAVVIAAIAVLIAYALLWLINLITNIAYYGQFTAAPVTPAGTHLGWWSVLVPIIGGLIIGFMARYGSDKIRGHGIPEALEAILIGRSKLEPKVAILKPLSSAISIGTGGPFGAEGPIIMTGGAFGSLFAQFFRLSSAERKTLLVAGASAGMAAVFAAPIAAVLLAVELLLYEWKPRSFIPVAFASVVAAALRVPLLGAGPMFPVAPHAALNGEGLFMAFLVGILAGIAASILTALVYGFEDGFSKLPVHWMWWPAIGGLFVGLGGMLDPRVLGVGYGTIHLLLEGQILGLTLLGLLFGKALVWSIALGSGTSGGVLAPLLMMGAAMGAFVGHWIPVGSPELWAMIGMAAVMGGTMRAPLTAIIFALELTHDFNIMTGLLVGCVAAQVVTVLLMRRSILTEKVARRGHHLTSELTVDPFEVHRVGEVMMQNVPTIPADMTVAAFAEKLSRGGDNRLARRQGAPIVDANGKLVGVITQSDVLRVLERHGENAMTVLQAGTADPIVTYPDDLLRDAVIKMITHDIGRLPVVERENPTKLVGWLGRAGVMSARLDWYEDEHVRERSWRLRGALDSLRGARRLSSTPAAATSTGNGGNGADQEPAEKPPVGSK